MALTSRVQFHRGMEVIATEAWVTCLLSRSRMTAHVHTLFFPLHVVMMPLICFITHDNSLKVGLYSTVRVYVNFCGALGQNPVHDRNTLYTELPPSPHALGIHPMVKPIGFLFLHKTS